LILKVGNLYLVLLTENIILVLPIKLCLVTFRSRQTKFTL